MGGSAQRLLAVVFALALVAGACGNDDDTSEATQAEPTATATATVAATPTATPTPEPAEAESAVVSEVFTFVDPTRPTNAVSGVHEAADDRTLETIVYYPDAPGPYPLIVFAHGITSSYALHLHILEELAAAGYVVAAPNFPETTGGEGFGAFANYANQPADVRFVIDELLASPVAELVDPERIGLVGHSLGGATVYGAAYSPEEQDPRVSAAAIIAGIRLPFGNSGFDISSPPLLLIHGDDDQTVSCSESERTFEESTADTWFVTLLGGEHSTWRDVPGAEQDVAVNSLIHFFDLQLKGDESARDRLEAGASVDGVATLETT